MKHKPNSWFASLTKQLSQTKTVILIALLAIATSLGFASTAQAAMHAVNPNVPMFDKAQNLYLMQESEGRFIKYDTNVSDDRLFVLNKKAGLTTKNQVFAPSPDPFGQYFGIGTGIMWNTDGPPLLNSGPANEASGYQQALNSSFAPNWPAMLFAVHNPTSSDYITTYHANVGEFNGRKINASVRYSNFQYKWIPDIWDNKESGQPYYKAARQIPTDTVFLDISGNLFGGVFYGNLKYVEATIKYMYADTNEEINLTGTNSFTTIGSLNTNEFSRYLNIDMNSETQIYDNVFVTNDTLVVQRPNALPNYGQPVFMGIADGGDKGGQDPNDFTDWMGGPTFSRSATAFKGIGVDQRIAVGHKDKARMVYTYSTASLGVPGVIPKKQVKDPLTGDYVDATKASPGTVLTYKIEQPVGYMNGTILQKYKKFNVSDIMDPNLEFVEGKVFTPDGKDITNEAGEWKIKTIEGGKHHGWTNATFVGNDHFMNQIMQYQGETYTYIITARVKKDVGQNVTIENLAQTTINDAVLEGEGGGVPVETYDPNIIEKFVRFKKSDVQEKDIELKEKETEFEYDFTMSVTDDVNLSEFSFYDNLEKALTFQSIQFFDENKNDITDQFYREGAMPDNEIQYNANPAYVHNLIGKKIYATMKVKIADTYDASMYKDGKIPNEAKIITNFDETTSDIVLVKPSEKLAKITKSFINHLGEVTDDLILQNNIDPIIATGEFTIPNKPEKDWKIKSVVIEEDLDPALEFKNETGDIIILDDTNKDVSDKFTIETDKEGQLVRLVANNNYLPAMRGRTYQIKQLKMYYRLGTDLSKYKDGKIPNTFKLIVNGEPTDSETPTIKPIPETEAPVKYIINPKGDKVQNYELSSNDEIVTYALQMLVPNDKTIKKMEITDTINPVYNFKQFILYKDETKKEVVFDSEKDMEKSEKGTLTTAKNIIKYVFAEKDVQKFANAHLYAELKVQLKPDADFSQLEDSKIPNSYIFAVNNEPYESNVVKVKPIPNKPTIEKKINYNNQLLDHREEVNYNEVIDYQLSVTTPNSTKLSKLVIHDVLDNRLITTTDLINQTKIIKVDKDGKTSNVTNNFKLEYNKTKNTVIFTLTDKFLENYQGSNKFNIVFGAKINPDLPIDTDMKNIPNKASLYLNDDPDGEESNTVTVTPSEPEGEDFTVGKVIREDGKDYFTKDDVQKDQAIPYVIKVNTPLGAEITELTIHDNLDARLKTSAKDINSATVTKDGKDVTKDFTLNYNEKENRVSATLNKDKVKSYQGRYTLEFAFNAYLNEKAEIKVGEKIENIGQLFINGETDPKETNKVVITPEKPNTGDKNDIKKSVLDNRDNSWNSNGFDYYPLSSLAFTDEDSEAAKNNPLVREDNRLKAIFRLDVTVNQATSKNITIQDKIQDGVEPKKVTVFSKDNNQETDITDKVQAAINGQQVTVVIPKDVYDRLGSNKLSINIETLLSEELSLTGKRIENNGTIQVDDNTPDTSNTVILNPKDGAPIDPTEPVDPTNPSGTGIEKFVLNQDDGKTQLGSWDKLDTNKELTYVLKASVKTTTKDVIITDDLPNEVTYVAGSAYVLNKDGGKTDVTTKGSLKNDGQKVTFNMTAKAFNALGSKEVYLEIRTKVNVQVKQGESIAFDNVASLSVDGKTTTSNKVPVNNSSLLNPNNNNGNNNSGNGNGGDNTGKDGNNPNDLGKDGGKLAQTGTKANLPIIWIITAIAFAGVAFAIYNDKRKKKLTTDGPTLTNNVPTTSEVEPEKETQEPNDPTQGGE